MVGEWEVTCTLLTVDGAGAIRLSTDITALIIMGDTDMVMETDITTTIMDTEEIMATAIMVIPTITGMERGDRPTPMLLETMEEDQQQMYRQVPLVEIKAQTKQM